MHSSIWNRAFTKKQIRDRKCIFDEHSLSSFIAGRILARFLSSDDMQGAQHQGEEPIGSGRLPEQQVRPEDLQRRERPGGRVHALGVLLGHVPPLLAQATREKYHLMRLVDVLTCPWI